MTEHTDRRDAMTKAIRDALSFMSDEPTCPVASVMRAEGNVLEVTDREGVVYTLRVAIKRPAGRRW